MARFHDKGDGVTVAYTPEEEATADAEMEEMIADRPTRSWDRLRSERNILLTESDWTQYNDSPLDEAKADWATYRQELRDLPANTDDPANPTWPSAPE